MATQRSRSPSPSSTTAPRPAPFVRQVSSKLKGGTTYVVERRPLSKGDSNDGLGNRRSAGEGREPNVVLVKVPDHVRTNPESASVEGKGGKGDGTLKMMPRSFCFCLQLRKGCMVIAVIYMVAAVASIIATSLLIGEPGRESSRWAFGLLIGFSGISIALDVFGLRAAAVHDTVWVKRYAVFQWIRMGATAFVYMATVAVTTDLNLMFGLIGMLLIEGYFSLCVWSYYTTLRDRPEMYGKPRNLTSTELLHQLADESSSAFPTSPDPSPSSPPHDSTPTDPNTAAGGSSSPFRDPQDSSNSGPAPPLKWEDTSADSLPSGTRPSNLTDAPSQQPMTQISSNPKATAALPVPSSLRSVSPLRPEAAGSSGMPSTSPSYRSGISSAAGPGTGTVASSVPSHHPGDAPLASTTVSPSPSNRDMARAAAPRKHSALQRKSRPTSWALDLGGSLPTSVAGGRSPLADAAADDAAGDMAKGKDGNRGRSRTPSRARERSAQPELAGGKAAASAKTRKERENERNRSRAASRAMELGNVVPFS
ncbi:hypothetical protein HDU96_008291 [Phlyctochytrium bullatum]|nr:hypothetical protein HDU96_008291 [Phlyctochytrium bullatum]